MFVRYLGGGIGHQATNEYTSSLRPEVHNTQSSFEMGEGANNDGLYSMEETVEESDLDLNENEQVDDGDEEEVDSQNDDWGYMAHNPDSGGSEEEEEGEDCDNSTDQDSGAEDGDEPWGMGDADAEGYADL